MAAAEVFVGIDVSKAHLDVAVRPVDGAAKVADCDGVETDLTEMIPNRLGKVAFGSTSGYNPCLGPQTPVRPTTWGSIKTLYEQ